MSTPTACHLSPRVAAVSAGSAGGPEASGGAASTRISWAHAAGSIAEVAPELAKPLAAVYRAVAVLVEEAKHISDQKIETELAEAARVRKENARLRAELDFLKDHTGPHPQSIAASDVTTIPLQEAKAAELPGRLADEGAGQPSMVAATTTINTRGSALSERHSSNTAAGDIAPRKLPLKRNSAQRMQALKRVMTALPNMGAEEPTKGTRLSQRRVFTDPDQMKEKVRNILMKPEHNSAASFYKTGVCQAIARSRWFEFLSLIVVSLNAVWIGIDAEFNREGVLVDAAPHFQVMEHLFCLYFQFDWWVRFLALRNKCMGLQDQMFALDTVLLGFMTFETWVMSIIVSIMRSSSNTFEADDGILTQTSMIRGLRLLRLVRIMRIARVFRSFPEIMVLIRAMTASIRTVFITLFFLLFADYVVAVALTQMARGTALEQTWFPSIIASMHTLLIVGAFPDQEILMRATSAEHLVYWLILFVFILFSTITVMNMMIGVLVEVVKNAQIVEKESLDGRLLRDNLLEAIHSLRGADVSDPSEVTLSKQDFWDLVEHPDATRVLQNTGIDVIGLVDLVDHIFQDSPKLHFSTIMETVLQLRSSNTATVKDLVDLRKYLTRELGANHPRLTEYLPHRQTHTES